MTAATTTINKHIIVTGLGGCGKTTFATTLGHRVIHCDKHRFGHNWSKLTPEEYYRSVNDDLQCSDSTCAIEGICNDIADPQNARFMLFVDLVRDGKIAKLYYFEPVALQAQIEALVSRSIGRALGVEPQGAYVETPADIARMVIKAVNGYESNMANLKELLDICRFNGVPVEKVEPH